MCVVRCISYTNTKFAVVSINVPIPVAARSEATRLPRLRVRIPPGTSMSLVSVVRCHCTGPITRPEESTECILSNCL
jgi:hypothetical protein